VPDARRFRGSNLAPLSPADYVNPEPADDEQHHVVPQPRPLRVLIADDERDTLVTLGVLCRDAGMDVRLVKWGADVIPATREFAPDVILLDLGMPDRGGNDIAEELTESYGVEVPTLIAVTGYSSEDDRRMARESGFQDFIAKPYDPQSLLKRLAMIKPRSA
jgi:DNA-binding response OmpR family regulator